MEETKNPITRAHEYICFFCKTHIKTQQPYSWLVYCPGCKKEVDRFCAHGTSPLIYSPPKVPVKPVEEKVVKRPVLNVKLFPVGRPRRHRRSPQRLGFDGASSGSSSSGSSGSKNIKIPGTDIAMET